MTEQQARDYWKVVMMAKQHRAQALEKRTAQQEERLSANKEIWARWADPQTDRADVEEGVPDDPPRTRISAKPRRHEFTIDAGLLAE